MALPYFLSAAVRVHISHMQGIAMAQTIGIQTCAIIVDSTGTIADLVFTVAIYITYCHLVVTLTCVAAVAGAVAVKGPAMSKLAIAPIPGHPYKAGIITPAHDQTGTRTVYIGNSGNEAVYPVTVIIAPGRYSATGRQASRR